VPEGPRGPDPSSEQRRSPGGGGGQGMNHVEHFQGTEGTNQSESYTIFFHVLLGTGSLRVICIQFACDTKDGKFPNTCFAPTTSAPRGKGILAFI
jgi:hypothetical protein